LSVYETNNYEGLYSAHSMLLPRIASEYSTAEKKVMSA